MGVGATRRTSAKRASGHDKEWEDHADQVFNVWRELRRGAARRLTAAFYGEGPDALEPAQIDALELLMTASEWRMAEFADALHVDPSTATRMVERLVNAGCATRGSSSLDGRGIVTSITKKGRAQVRRVEEGRREVMWEFLRDFSDDDIAILVQYMTRFANGIAAVAAERSL